MRERMMEVKKGMKKRRGMMVGRRLEQKGKAVSLEESQALLFPLHLYRYPPAALEKCMILKELRISHISYFTSKALALGMCRSCVKVEGKDSSATLQPFYTLQLDIQVVWMYIC